MRNRVCFYKGVVLGSAMLSLSACQTRRVALPVLGYLATFSIHRCATG
jgi:hypothetical protein